jgi:hypothetical protein
MSDNFVIGNTPIPEENLCSLKFHQFTIYDSENWLQSGTLRWNATTKNFEVLPDPPLSENSDKETIINNTNVNSKKIIIPKKNK